MRVSRISADRSASKHACVIAARCIARDASRLRAARNVKKKKKKVSEDTTRYKRTEANVEGAGGGTGRVARATTPSTKPGTQFTDRYSPLFVFTAAARESTWSIPGAHPIPCPYSLPHTGAPLIPPPVARTTPRYLPRSNSVAVPAVVLN